MIVQISHKTEYTYTEPVLTSAQYLRLTPRSGPTQSVTRWSISCHGATLTEWVDHFGNICHTLTTDRARGEIVLEVSGEVRTFETHGVIPAQPGEMPADAYMRPSQYTEADAKLRKYAGGFRAAMKKDPIDGLHKLMTGIFEKVAYSEGETSVHTTAAEAFADGKGVCQDHAHVFIACCKHLDIPARYVSGYLATGESDTEHSASHAWAEALVPDLGWVAFDAANGVSATEAYVRTAAGFDYSDAGPVRGVRIGGGSEAMTVAIRLDSQ